MNVCAVRKEKIFCQSRVHHSPSRVCSDPWVLQTVIESLRVPLMSKHEVNAGDIDMWPIGS